MSAEKNQGGQNAANQHTDESGIFQHSLEVFDLSVDFSKSQKVTLRNIRINNQQHQRFFR